MSNTKLSLLCEATGTKIELDWDVLRRSLDVLLKLAPPELRTPPDFLDEVYEQKKMLSNLFNDVAQKEAFEDGKTIIGDLDSEEENDRCFDCHAYKGCEYAIGSDNCIQRREEFNK
jgi:hypothetical protein